MSEAIRKTTTTMTPRNGYKRSRSCATIPVSKRKMSNKLENDVAKKQCIKSFAFYKTEIVQPKPVQLTNKSNIAVDCSNSSFLFDAQNLPLDLVCRIFKFCCPIDIAAVCCTSKNNHQILNLCSEKQHENDIVNEMWKWFYYNDMYCRKFTSLRPTLKGSLPPGKTFKSMVIGISTGRCYECQSKKFYSYAGVPLCTECDDPTASHYLTKTQTLNMFRKVYGINEKLLNNVARRVRESGCRRYDGNRRAASYLFRVEDLRWHLESDKDWVKAKKLHKERIYKTKKKAKDKKERAKSALIKALMLANKDDKEKDRILNHPMCQKMIAGKLRMRKDMKMVIDTVLNIEDRRNYVEQRLKMSHKETKDICKEFISEYIEHMRVENVKLPSEALKLYVAQQLSVVSKRLHERDRELSLLTKEESKRICHVRVQEYVSKGTISDLRTGNESLKDFVSLVKAQVKRESEVQNLISQLPLQIRVKIPGTNLSNYIKYGSGKPFPLSNPLPSLEEIVKSAIDHEKRLILAKLHLSKFSPPLRAHVSNSFSKFIVHGTPCLPSILKQAKEYEDRSCRVGETLLKLKRSVRCRVSATEVSNYLEFGAGINDEADMSPVPTLEVIVEKAREREKRAKEVDAHLCALTKSARGRLTKSEINSHITVNEPDLESLITAAWTRDERAKQLDEEIASLGLKSNIRSRINRSTRLNFIVSGFPSVATIIQEAKEKESRENVVKFKLSQMSERTKSFLTDEEIKDCILNMNGEEADEMVAQAVRREQRAAEVSSKMSSISETVKYRIRKQTLDLYIRYGAIDGDEVEGEIITDLDTIIQIASRQHSLV